MLNQLRPVVDQWYANGNKEGMFRVVAMDEAAGTIEIQQFGGDVQELDADDWRHLQIEPIEPPEDWRGPFDDLEADDLGDADLSAGEPQDWRLSVESPLGGESRADEPE